MNVLVDTNILLRWNIRTAPESQLVIRAIDALLSAGDSLCYTSQNLGEFWNVITRPVERNGFGLSPMEADRRARIIESRLLLLPDHPAIHLEWRRLLIAHLVSGVQVHDARLVAFMSHYGVLRILTLNARDFARSTSIQTVHPSQIARP